MHLCRQQKVLVLTGSILSLTLAQPNRVWAQKSPPRAAVKAPQKAQPEQDDDDVEANPSPQAGQVENSVNSDEESDPQEQAKSEQQQQDEEDTEEVAQRSITDPEDVAAAEAELRAEKEAEIARAEESRLAAQRRIEKLSRPQRVENIPRREILESDEAGNGGWVLQENAQGADGPLVELRRSIDWNQSFRERRPGHGWMFSIASASLLLDNFVITEDGTNLAYEKAYGTAPVASPEVFFGYKYNTSLGAIHVDLGYGYLKVAGSRSGVLRTLAINRPTARAGLILDNLFSEPYVAPYINYSVWQMTIKESNSVGEVEYDTGIGTSLTAGLLLQLNWLDKSAAFLARKNFGIENTFLDIFVTQQIGTDDMADPKAPTAIQLKSDPDVSTDPSFGVGLRIEF